MLQDKEKIKNINTLKRRWSMLIVVVVSVLNPLMAFFALSLSLEQSQHLRQLKRIAQGAMDAESRLLIFLS